MTRHLAAIIVIFAVLLGGIFLLLNTTWLLSHYVPKYFAEHYADIELNSLKIKKQSFKFPDRLSVYDISMNLGYKDKIYDVTAKRVTLQDVENMVKNRRQVRAEIEGFSVKTDYGDLQNFDVKLLLLLKDTTIIQYDSIFRGETANLFRYTIESLSARLRGNRKEAQVFEIAAYGYGSDLKGQVQLQMKPALNYVFWFEFQNADSQDLYPINKQFFSQLEGLIDGTVRVNGTLESIDIFDANISLLKGGVIHSGLVRKMSKKIVDDDTLVHLQSLLEEGGGLYVDKAAFNIRNSNDRNLKLFISLQQDAGQLRLKKAVDFYIEEGLFDFLLK